ncbi:MAG: hypothetical protein IPJ37_17170 [Bacteroidales bacterium]|nr:hypothetical protein [Bacteroidales bacterium]
MDTTKIYIYGASGHGKVIRDILEAQGKVVTGFIDDDILKTRFTGLQVIKVDSSLIRSLIA